MKEEHVITVKRNGTTFTVVLKTTEGAKIEFEELMRKKIGDAVETLKLLFRGRPPQALYSVKAFPFFCVHQKRP